MSNILLVIDMQNDFITGSLGTQEAQSIVANVNSKIAKYRAGGERVLFTRDTHGAEYLTTAEGKKLPVEHCIKDTWGWELEESLDVRKEDVIVDKPNFGWPHWNTTFTKMDGEQTFVPTNIEMIGLCTDICVVSNALILKAQYPDAEITVDASCCAGVTPATHKAALETMKMCQINVVGA